ncbi:MAG: PPC domain-containing protein [Planctomycetes bacterium]|nr:PPC domain-containing protein [Planctomycetota bacterium]
MRFITLLAAFATLTAVLHAKPVTPETKPEPVPPFKPIEIKSELAENDPKDKKLNNPSKKYTVKLHKDRTYLIELESKAFDAYLRLLDKSGSQVAEDTEGGGGEGDHSSRLLYNANVTGDFHVIATSFDGMVGKFTLKVRELNLKGEAQARALGKDGLSIAGVIGEKDATDVAKLSKVHTVQLKAGASYIFDADSSDFDSQVYLFNGKSKFLTQGAGNIIHVPTTTGDHHVVVASFDKKPGKFTLGIREVNLQGEARPRPVGKDGITINSAIAENDKTDLGKLTKVLSVQLKAGQAYMFDAKAEGFDCQLYLFDGKSKYINQDQAVVIFTATADGVHHLVVKAFDKQPGKFEVKVNEFNLKGEAEPREVGKNGVTIAGQIGNNDKSAVGKLGKVYSVELKAGQTYTIDLDSKDMDAYLYLFDSKSALLAQDDDSGGDLNSRIIFRAERDGTYHIVATSLGGTETGEFTLKVRKQE